ncbi:hypothetical protein D1007_55492 [Hordeum vulgare]|nr:hypothetical protein D1007_55492 [Hordeum vulgare]
MAENMAGKAAVTPKNMSIPGPSLAATPTCKPVDPASRGSSESPVESKTPDPAASLSAQLGSMVLMDKEVEGLVFSAPEHMRSKTTRWVVVGKSCSPRPLNMIVLERTMQRAWELHKEAWFRDLGGNVFSDYEGGTRPSEMVFDKVEIWVHDLPPDRRTKGFGNALRNCLGKVMKVDADKDGKARG